MKRSAVALTFVAVAVLGLFLVGANVSCSSSSCCSTGGPRGGGMSCCHGAAKAGADVKVVNSRCPIMGGALDQNNVPSSLTRDFKGQKVGFCCAGCPAQWDKLSDAEKDAKLKAAFGAK